MRRSTWRCEAGAGTCSTSSSTGARISRSVDVYTVLNTYNVELYERFRALAMT